MITRVYYRIGVFQGTVEVEHSKYWSEENIMYKAERLIRRRFKFRNLAYTELKILPNEDSESK